MNLYICIDSAHESDDAPRSEGPGFIQTALFFQWPYLFVSRCQRRFGDVFTLSLMAPGEELGTIVYVADPDAISQLFRRDGKEAHAGVANKVLEPITGPQSILLLDREEHLRERRVLASAFHGDALRALGPIVGQATRREIATWPDDGIFPLRPAMQRITFEVIMRAVLGVRDPALQGRLATALEPVFNISAGQIVGLLPTFRIDLGPLTPWGRFQRSVRQLDDLLLGLISERRRDGGGQGDEDILGQLLAATDETGEPLSDRHLRDELVTLLLAGHETTATSLAWAFERLAHNPKVLSGIRSQIANGSQDMLDAVAAETLRTRPVVMDVARRLSDEAEIGGYLLPAGTTVMPAIYLVHNDPNNFHAPDAFRPDRYQGPPTRSTWLPFGGGRRRCVGAAFAQMEMRTVLSLVLREFSPEPSSSKPERARLRGVTFAPENGARLRMRRSPP
jgi:cytochrome P450